MLWNIALMQNTWAWLAYILLLTYFTNSTVASKVRSPGCEIVLVRLPYGSAGVSWSKKHKQQVWVYVAEIYICSISARPGGNHADFQRLLNKIVRELRGRRPAIIAGNFNDWGSKATNRRGAWVLDNFFLLDVAIMNTVSCPNFSKNGNGSNTDVTSGRESRVLRVVSSHSSRDLGPT